MGGWWWFDSGKDPNSYWILAISVVSKEETLLYFLKYSQWTIVNEGMDMHSPGCDVARCFSDLSFSR